MTPQDFQKLCKDHDWSFSFSDDFRVYIRSNPVQREIEGVVRSVKGKFDSDSEQIKAIWLKWCFLPWSIADVTKAYAKLRSIADAYLGVQVRKDWEANTTLATEYLNLPRYKQGWWWICELSRFIENETGKSSRDLGSWNYSHIHIV